MRPLPVRVPRERFRRAARDAQALRVETGRKRPQSAFQRITISCSGVASRGLHGSRQQQWNIHVQGNQCPALHSAGLACMLIEAAWQLMCVSRRNNMLLHGGSGCVPQWRPGKRSPGGKMRPDRACHAHRAPARSQIRARLRHGGERGGRGEVLLEDGAQQVVLSRGRRVLREALLPRAPHLVRHHLRMFKQQCSRSCLHSLCACLGECVNINCML